MSSLNLPLSLVDGVRDTFADLYEEGEFIVDKTGKKVVEICAAQFVADDETIFGKPNTDYINREIKWYLDMSLFVDDFPGGAPSQWKQVASSRGMINSNYGFLAFHPMNGSQYLNVLKELINFPQSRRAQIIYNRPTIWRDYNIEGMSDFICTNAVQYMIRNSKLETIVSMRSNDAIWGYRNDYAWQRYISNRLLNDLNAANNSRKLELGSTVWNVGSLHIYERHFHLIENYIETGHYQAPVKRG